MITKMKECVVMPEKDSRQIFYHTNQGRLLAIKAMNKLKKMGPRKYKEVWHDISACIKFLETSLRHWPDFEPPLDGS